MAKQLTEKEIANQFHWAMYCMDRGLTTEYFQKFCADHLDMHFGPSMAKHKDPLMGQVYVGLHSYLTEHGVQDLRAMTAEDLQKAITTPVHDIARNEDISVKDAYDRWIGEKAKEILMAAHESQKPIILISEMDAINCRHIADATRYRTAEIQMMMNVPVSPLAAPETENEKYLNLKYRQLESIKRFDSFYDKSETLLFETKDAAFVYCPNKAVAQKLDEMQKEFLLERGLPLPELGGRAGVLQAIAEYNGITQPDIMKEFIGSGGKFREDALSAVEHICEAYNDQGMPIYATPLDTCFQSLDGGFHNYPILMLPGDQITVSSNNVAVLGDHEGILPESMTVLSTHTNEHGSVVITDAGVFACGGVGKNAIDQVMGRSMDQSIEEHEVGNAPIIE